MKLFSKIILILILFLSFLKAESNNELVFYIGITMVKPVDELAKNFEKTHDCKIKILQGGSQDLYDSIKSSQVGDLYLPGTPSFRTKNLAEGLLLDGKFVGYNKLALVVKKGNPKKIKPSLDELTNKNYNVVLGNEEIGSVGQATKTLLTKVGLYEKAMLNAVSLATDSRNLVNTIKDGTADLTLNWNATTYWEENINDLESIELEDQYSEKSKLVMSLLNTSKNKELTREFMNYATSKEGKMIFFGIGTDIVEVERIEKSINRTEKFLEKVFTKREVDYCNSKPNRYERYAGRFCAKEAVSKALGTGVRNFKLTDMEILNDELDRKSVV